MKKIKKYLLLNILFRGIIYFVIGILLLVLPPSFIVKTIYILFGSIIILISISPLIESGRNLQFKENYLVFLFSLVLFIGGVMLLINPSKVVLSLIVIFLIIIPTYNIYISNNKPQQFRIEFSKVIIGFLIILIGFEEIIGTMIILSGIIMIALGIYNIILSIRLK